MSFIISFVLACTTILATFMLQLCDDGLNKSSPVIGLVSFVGILIALYFVDYKKKFALSKTACNALVILAIAVQIGALTRSRQDFLAFAIANILASLQTILFFQSKTLRKCYQIVSIAFVEVAVGCVFQRSSLFVVALPVFVVLGFACYSLLFLWGERKYYSERVALKSRFSGSKNLKLITAEEPLHAPEYKPVDAFDSVAAQQFAQRATAGDEPRFFRRPSTFPIHFTVEYFKRFVLGSLTAFVFGCVFFCLFPRMDEFGFGALTFDQINWGGGRGNFARTGFKPSIELGDLAPTIDSKEVVLTAQIRNTREGSPFELDPHSPIYLRGIPLANYQDRRWSELDTRNGPIDNFSLLQYRIDAFTLADSSFILSYLLQFASENDLRPNEAARNNFEFRITPPPTDPSRSSVYSISSQPRSRVETEMTRRPVLDVQPFFLSSPNARGRFRDVGTIEALLNLVRSGAVEPERLKYDSRSDVIAFEIEQQPLDTPVVFLPLPVAFAASAPNIASRPNNSIEFIDRARGGWRGTATFLSTAFTFGRQTQLAPNQEKVWGVLPQYLMIDPDKFPKLVEKARMWDAESKQPKENFIARAKYIESRLRDAGEYKYNRSGVLRDPDVDPLEDFISENKEGHCEYFAGALAMMLRAVGIPSRVVVGFAAYPDSDSKEMTVRQSDAHSWVEAYVPPDKLPDNKSAYADLFAGAVDDGSGGTCMPLGRDWTKDGAWLRLDATPAAERDADRPNALAIQIFTWSRFFHNFGNDWVLNFNAARQMRNVYEPIARAVKSTIEYLRRLRENFSSVGDFLRSVLDSFKNALAGDWSSTSIFVVFSVLALLAVLLYLFFKLGRSVAKNAKRAIERAKEKEAKRMALLNADPSIKLYAQLEEALGRRLRAPRKGAETPREFLEQRFVMEDQIVAGERPIPVETIDSNVKDRRGVLKHGKEKTKNRVDARANPIEAPSFAPTPSNLRARLRELVEIYYRAQYGGVGVSKDQANEWSGVLDDALKLWT